MAQEKLCLPLKRNGVHTTYVPHKALEMPSSQDHHLKYGRHHISPRISEGLMSQIATEDNDFDGSSALTPPEESRERGQHNYVQIGDAAMNVSLKDSHLNQRDEKKMRYSEGRKNQPETESAIQWFIAIFIIALLLGLLVRGEATLGEGGNLKYIGKGKRNVREKCEVWKLSRCYKNVKKEKVRYFRWGVGRRNLKCF